MCTRRHLAIVHFIRVLRQLLCSIFQTEVWHYQIRRHGEDAFFSIDDQTPIHGLDSLIEHYREDANGLITQLLHVVKGDAPPHDSRSHGRTNLLHRATRESNTKDGYSTVIAILESRNYNIDAKSQDGQTAMHLACCHGTEEIIRKFIDCGANVNCRDKDGNTPLHVSAPIYSYTILRILRESRARSRFVDMITEQRLYSPFYRFSPNSMLVATNRST